MTISVILRAISYSLLGRQNISDTKWTIMVWMFCERNTIKLGINSYCIKSLSCKYVYGTIYLCLWEKNILSIIIRKVFHFVGKIIVDWSSSVFLWYTIMSYYVYADLTLTQTCQMSRIWYTYIYTLTLNIQKGTYLHFRTWIGVMISSFPIEPHKRELILNFRIPYCCNRTEC